MAEIMDLKGVYTLAMIDKMEKTLEEKNKELDEKEKELKETRERLEKEFNDVSDLTKDNYYMDCIEKASAYIHDNSNKEMRVGDIMHILEIEETAADDCEISPSDALKIGYLIGLGRSIKER